MQKRKPCIYFLAICGVIILFLIIIVIYTLKDNNPPAYEDFSVGESNNEAKCISLINLIATPEKYDGKAVMVEGFFRCETGSDRLYLTENDYTEYISANAVSLDLVDMDISVDRQQLKMLNGCYVLIEGTFDYNDEGHPDWYSGHIKNINRIN